MQARSEKSGDAEQITNDVVALCLDQVAELLDERGIYVWDGNYYAINVTERLGVEDSGGMVRIGAAHYNTLEEIDRLGEALEDISKE